MLIDTMLLLNALKARLQDLPLPDSQGARLFEFVALSDPLPGMRFAQGWPLYRENSGGEENGLQAALARLGNFAARRVCLIVPSGDTYQATDTGADGLFLQRKTDFALIIADKSYTILELAAAFGNNETLGAIKAKDIVVGALTGQSLGLPGVAIKPGNGSLLSAGADDRSRPFWVQLFSSTAGDFPVPPCEYLAIDRAITARHQLPPAAAAGAVKCFINPKRDSLECHEYRADGKWHQVL